MAWRTRYVLKSCLSSSIWLAPLAAYVVSLVVIRALGWLVRGCNGNGRGSWT